MFGLDATIQTEPEQLESLKAQWAWCLPDSEAQRDIAVMAEPKSHVKEPPFTIRRDGQRDEQGAHLGDYTVTTELTSGAIWRRAQQFLMFHAGGVTKPGTGSVAMLVAASGTGKTTATRFYCSNGYGYVTDETLITNPQHEVMPYPKPLSVIINPENISEKSQHGPDDLGLTMPQAGPLSLDAVVLLERDRDGRTADAAPSLEPMGLFEGLSLILPQSSAMLEIDGCLDVLAKLCCESGGIYRLQYREISETLALLDEAFNREPIEPFWTHVPGTFVRTPSSEHELYNTYPALEPEDVQVRPETVYVRETFLDALVWEESMEVLLLSRALPAHLKGIGALIWLELEQERSLAELVDICVETFGAHPDAHDLITDAVRQMCQTHVIREA